jgi:hypothetical protein
MIDPQFHEQVRAREIIITQMPALIVLFLFFSYLFPHPWDEAL